MRLCFLWRQAFFAMEKIAIWCMPAKRRMSFFLISTILRKDWETSNRIFSFVYDHSLEWQDQAALTTQWAPLGGFQEIVRLESGRTLLARVLRQSEKETTVILSDISLVYQRTQALLQANEQNKILLDAVEAAPNGIFIADAQLDDFPILFVNTAISLLLGGGGRTFGWLLFTRRVDGKV
jgi:PAS domain-containing protein